jgi:hypothetical protein
MKSKLWNDFLWRKYERKQSICLGEINFDHWTYTHSSDELHMCIMSKGHLGFRVCEIFIDVNWSN